MNDQHHVLALRELILDRLGCPEPELPGIHYVGYANRDSDAIQALFDEMCMHAMDECGALVEAAMRLLEQVRERDYATFYLGRSELLRLFPIECEPPTAPFDDDELSESPFELGLSRTSVIALTGELLGN